MCLGGHLALRCAFDTRVTASVCYFPTDIHSSTLGLGKNDNSLSVMTTIKGEVILIFGKKDNHVSPAGRVCNYYENDIAMGFIGSIA